MNQNDNNNGEIIVLRDNDNDGYDYTISWKEKIAFGLIRVLSFICYVASFFVIIITIAFMMVLVSIIVALTYIFKIDYIFPMVERKLKGFFKR